MSWKKIEVVLSAVALIASLSKTAFAWDPATDCPPLPKKSIEAQMLAGEWFNRAEKSYRDGDSETSLKQFLCSFQIVQHENTVFNIAQIAKLSQERDVYLRLLKNFVSGARGSAKIDPIREIIEELEADVSVNLTKAEMETVETNSDGVPELLGESSESAAVEASDRSERKRRMLKAGGLVSVGVGIVGLSVGAALQAMAKNAADDAEAAETMSSFNSAESQMHGLQAGAIAGFAVGGATAVAGMVCLVVAGRKGERSAAISILPGVGELTLAGRF